MKKGKNKFFIIKMPISDTKKMMKLFYIAGWLLMMTVVYLL